jgi:hypothetical protein
MTKNKKEEYGTLPSGEQIEKFEMLYGLLNAIVGDMKNFAKKKPDEVLNKVKVKTINKILMQIKDSLIDSPIKEFLELLDEETLPTNSDAVLIIGQFQSAMNQFKSKYHGWDKEGRINRWFTKENPGTPYGGPRIYKAY